MVRNVYPNEQKKLDQEASNLFEMDTKIKSLLNDYGYEIEAYLVNGVPRLKYVKVA